MSEEMNLETASRILSEEGIEVLPVEETLGRLQKMAQVLRPQILYYFLKPNAVLYMAGMKGLADIPFTPSLEQADILAFEEVLPGQVRVMNNDVSGVEASSIHLIDEGFYNRRQYLVEDKNLEPYDNDEANFHHETILRLGCKLGYPMQAIMDFADFVHKRESGVPVEMVNDDQERTILEVEGKRLVPLEFIPKNLIHNDDMGAIPEFEVYEESLEGDAIRAYSILARNILEGVYSSDWYKKIVGTDDYIDERGAYKERKREFIERNQ